MSDTVRQIDAPRKSTAPQVVDSSMRTTCIPTIAERICYRFSRGALERYLASEYEVRREFVEALIRRDYQRLLRENAELRAARRAA